MNEQNTVDFIVVKREYSYTDCLTCDGSGKCKHEFRKMIFVYDCPECKGSGVVSTYIESSISLIEALRELKVEINLNK